jgi:hypothetical protein
MLTMTERTYLLRSIYHISDFPSGGQYASSLGLDGAFESHPYENLHALRHIYSLGWITATELSRAGALMSGTEVSKMKYLYHYLDLLSIPH